MRNLYFFCLTGLILFLDQLSKLAVKRYLELYQSVPVLGEKFFRLTYVENDGIAFGLSFGGSHFLLIFNILAVIFLVYYIIKLRSASLSPKLALALILGGALGNLVDRIFHGQVIDFIDFDFPDWIMARWPVFNLADSSVSIGMAILIFYLLFLEKPHPSSNLQTKYDATAPNINLTGGGKSEKGAD
jgi:signal peptidase II